MLIDDFQRSITYLRLALTDRCNFRCQYCMPAEGLNWLPSDTLLQDAEIEFLMREVFIPSGITKVRLTGGEPMLRKGLITLVTRLANLPGLTDLSMTTNGVFLAQHAERLAKAGLRRVNISLDSMRTERFAEITRGGNLQRTLQGISAALSANLSQVKVNMVVIPGINDDEILDLASLTIDRPLHVRFIEMMDLGDHAFFAERKFLPVKRVADRIREHYALEPPTDQVPGNGPAVVLRIAGAKGTLGFISPMSQTFCHSCNRLRLTADGKIKPCLMRSQEIDLLGALRQGFSGTALRRLVVGSLSAKPLHHEWGANQRGSRTMSQIGG
ncbi:MAG: GTP 3',8-cyclase MoaA [Cyanobacteria bacterium NC_groundwater_1444_Ag_S-0.65um_54_12]|nr:GTP 3',8-cyclase MoaA [Cyanobacteria bacterium NC_groundwater_1444_Ag_S-0.65um_54_12]